MAKNFRATVRDGIDRDFKMFAEGVVGMSIASHLPVNEDCGSPGH